jgi:molecular chaperone GrpE
LSKQGKNGDEEATMKVTLQMLEVIDNFNRAFGAVQAETEEEKAIEAAYKKSYEGILSVFKDLEVQEIPTLGTEFDYEVHQAVMQRPHEDYEEGIVCDELQKGYTLGGKLVRAAMVSVAA